jgi:hypothetical protein
MMMNRGVQRAADRAARVLSFQTMVDWSAYWTLAQSVALMRYGTGSGADCSIR